MNPAFAFNGMYYYTKLQQLYIKGFHQQTARQLKTMQWRSIQIAVFTRAWHN